MLKRLLIIALLFGMTAILGAALADEPTPPKPEPGAGAAEPRPIPMPPPVAPGQMSAGPVAPDFMRSRMLRTQCPLAPTAPRPSDRYFFDNPTIGLTEDQKTKVRALFDRQEQKMKEASTALESATKDLVAELKSEKASAAKAKELASKASKVEADALQANADFWVELRGLLSADQSKQLSQMLERRMIIGFPGLPPDPRSGAHPLPPGAPPAPTPPGAPPAGGPAPGAPPPAPGPGAGPPVSQ